jgi:hypothetical protein
MPIDFPNTPSSGDTYTVGSKTWQFDGSSWIAAQGTGNMANSSVTDDGLVANSVTNAKIANLGVSSTDFADNSVTYAKCASNLSFFTITTSANLATDIPSPFTGQLIYETDNMKVRAWTGSAWIPITIS